MMNTTLIKDTLVQKSTIANKSTRRITGADLGAELFAEWKIACREFWNASYDYEHAKTVNMGEDSEVDNTVAMDTLKVLLDLIGEVNGHKLRRKSDMLSRFTPKVYRAKTVLTGKAETLAETKRKVGQQIREIKAGMNEEYIEGLHKEYAQLEEELKLAKKELQSGNNKDVRVNETTFRGIIEDELAKIIQEQTMIPREVLDAEEAERKARKKAAKKAAKAKAEAK